MPKDNESVPLHTLLSDEPGVSPSPQPFAPEQMVRCESCLRANAPTRVSCLYCGASLPVTEAVATVQKPTLRPLAKWERGYNNILLPSAANLTAEQLAEAADVLKLASGDLERIISWGVLLPLAHVATPGDASVIESRLARLQIRTQVVSDEELGVDETQIVRVRGLCLDEAGLSLFQTPKATPVQLNWADPTLIVIGRLVTTRVEIREQRARGNENRITDSSEFVTDELVIDLYAGAPAVSYRIASNNFDFSSLGPEKSLTAGENISKLVGLLRDRLPNVECDYQYNSLRKTLEAVWPSEQHNESRGLHRGGPGKISIGSATETNNEMQFLRYSRLRCFLLSKLKGDDA